MHEDKIRLNKTSPGNKGNNNDRSCELSWKYDQEDDDNYALKITSREFKICLNLQLTETN